MNAAEVLKYGHLTVVGTLEGLPEVDWTPGGVCGVWSVKEIIAHLASCEWVLVDVLRSFLSNEPTPALDKMIYLGPEGFNDEEVGARQGLSVAEVVAEYNNAQAQTMNLVIQIPPAKRREVGLLPWYGAEYDLEDYITYGYYGHKREHCAQVAVYREQLGR